MLRILFLLTALLVGCGPDRVPERTTTPDTRLLFDGGHLYQDVPTGTDALATFDFTSGLGCPGSLGCYCGQGAPCAEGLCLGNVCTTGCGGTCPPDWICEFTGQGADRVMACIPQATEDAKEEPGDVPVGSDASLTEMAEGVGASPEVEADVPDVPDVPLSPAGPPCSEQFIEVLLDGKAVCAPDLPVWGLQPVKPTTVGFVDNADGTVTDIYTGMTWQKSFAAGKHQQAAYRYCDNLSAGGFTDWRLPTVAEGMSLMDWSALKSSNEAPAVVVLDAVFPNGCAAPGACPVFRTLSSANEEDTPYYVVTVHGVVTAAGNTPFATRCVRHKEWPAIQGPRYLKTPFTWKDVVTGLEWQKDAVGPGFTVKDLSTYCASGDGWRTPSIEELMSLLNRQNAPGTTVTTGYLAYPTKTVGGADSLPFLSNSVAYSSNSHPYYFIVDFVGGSTALASLPAYTSGSTDWFGGYLRCVR